MNRPDRAAFLKLHPTVQQKLYELRWQGLRHIQVATIEAFFEDDRHLLLLANTIAGKTEAAFLPIVSQIVSDAEEGLRVLYIGSLGALLDEQFSRIEDLCALSEISVHKWFDGASADRRKTLREMPEGIMLTTPDALESFFLDHPAEIADLFAHTSWIVIDDFHALMGTERGIHLKSLVSRINQRKKRPARIVGLSAAAADCEAAKLWLAPRAPESVQIVREYQNDAKMVQLSVRAYAPDETTPEGMCSTHYVEEIPSLFPAASLILAPNPEIAETTQKSVQAYAAIKNLPNRYYLFEDTTAYSEDVRRPGTPGKSGEAVIFCPETLEPKLDAAGTERVGQIGAPWSVNALRQRLARSGRTGSHPSSLCMFVSPPKTDSEDLIAGLQPDLLRAVALVELLLEKWHEPCDITTPYYATLVQQILSVVAERGAISPKELFETLVYDGEFINVTIEEYKDILKCLGSAGIIGQSETRELFLETPGTDLVRAANFSASGITRHDMPIVHQEKQIGRTNLLPLLEDGGNIALPSGFWKIASANIDGGTLFAEPVAGATPPRAPFRDIEPLHARVREKMRALLAHADIPVYLSQPAKELLQAAKDYAETMQLLHTPFRRWESDVYWLTWTSSAVNLTLRKLCASKGCTVDDCGVALRFHDTSVEDVQRILGEILREKVPQEVLTGQFRLSDICWNRYDRFLPEGLLVKTFMQHYIDTAGAYRAIEGAR